MLGFFSLFHDRQNVVKKEEIFFVSVPENLPSDQIKYRFSKIAKIFAEKLNAKHVFLNYGKDDYIEYEYTI